MNYYMDIGKEGAALGFVFGNDHVVKCLPAFSLRVRPVKTVSTRYEHNM